MSSATKSGVPLPSNTPIGPVDGRREVSETIFMLRLISILLPASPFLLSFLSSLSSKIEADETLASSSVIFCELYISSDEPPAFKLTFSAWASPPRKEERNPAWTVRKGTKRVPNNRKKDKIDLDILLTVLVGDFIKQTEYREISFQP